VAVTPSGETVTTKKGIPGLGDGRSRFWFSCPLPQLDSLTFKRLPGQSPLGLGSYRCVLECVRNLCHNQPETFPTRAPTKEAPADGSTRAPNQRGDRRVVITTATMTPLKPLGQHIEPTPRGFL